MNARRVSGQRTVEDILRRHFEKENQEKGKPPSTDAREEEPKIIIPTSIDPSEYIQIPGLTTVIAKQESCKGKKWYDAHFALAESGLYMPRIDQFIRYVMHVKDAAEGRTTLHDAAHNALPQTEAEDLYKYFTSGHRGGCWTWLDAVFPEENGILVLETDHRVIQRGPDQELEGKKMLLICPLREDSYVTLAFNQQGFPETKAPQQKYEQGQNIRFYYPRKDCVAWFGAGSDRTVLVCYWGPGNSISGLGVFACAEGARKK